MTKRVKFAENTSRRGRMQQIPQRKHPHRSSGAYTNGFAGVHGNRSAPRSRIKRLPPPRAKEPVVGSIEIPTTLAAGPFLVQSRLTPCQRRYLCSIAASHNSDEQVKRLLTQHYMNIAHRCIKTGGETLADRTIKVRQSLEASRILAERREAERLPEIPKSGGKHPNKKSSHLPKTNNNRHKRVSPVSNAIKPKKAAANKSRTVGEQAKVSTTKAKGGHCKPNVQRDDSDSEDSLDELLRALSMEDEDEDEDEELFL